MQLDLWMDKKCRPIPPTAAEDDNAEAYHSGLDLSQLFEQRDSANEMLQNKPFISQNMNTWFICIVHFVIKNNHSGLLFLYIFYVKCVTIKGQYKTYRVTRS